MLDNLQKVSSHFLEGVTNGREYLAELIVILARIQSRDATDNDVITLAHMLNNSGELQ